MINKLLFGTGHEPPRSHSQTVLGRHTGWTTSARQHNLTSSTAKTALGAVHACIIASPVKGNYNDFNHIHIYDALVWQSETIYGGENGLQIYKDKELDPLSGRSISNRQTAICKIIASNIRKLVTEHLSAHLTP